MAACGSTGSSSDSDKLVTIKTELGDMTLLLYDETPNHKANFISLAESGDLDSTIFHRVIENFMIQGGDMYLNNPGMEPADKRLEAEIVDKFFHKKGELAAARQPDQVNPTKKSSSCQFYIVQGRVWTEEELTTNVTLLQQSLGVLLQKEEFDTLQQKFISLQQQRDFEEMNRLMASAAASRRFELG